MNSSWAQDLGAITTGKPNPLYPDESLITFQWSYACPENRPSTFVCRGARVGENQEEEDQEGEEYQEEEEEQTT